MTTYLIDELSCDVNECDTDGRSPLYFAVKCESFDVVQLLLNRGARNFPASRNQMSPIMLAAEKRCSDIVNAIAPYCSTLEQIEAEELLGSAFACAEHGPCDLQKSFQYFYQAIENRSIYNLPKSLRQTTSQVFDNRQECQI
jgi:ankyrin repeat protein